MRVADRIQHVSEYYFASKLAEIRALQANGADIINLGIGSPDMMPDPSVTQALVNASQTSGAYQYKPYKGVAGLRSAISSWYGDLYGVELSEDACLPLIGSKEGIGFISLAFINEGEEVLVPDPGYLAYQSATRMAGGHVVSYNMTAESGWQPDPDEIESLINERTRIIWLNLPSMPTGVQADPDAVKRILTIAERHDILVVNDNPYSLVLYDRPFSIHQIRSDAHVMELNSLSKSCNLAGMRFGMATGKPELLNAVFKVQSNLESGMFEPVQKAAMRAMELGDDWYSSLNQAYMARKDVARDFLDSIGCRVEGSDGGLFLWARIPDQIENSIEFVDELLSNHKVFLAPGAIFGGNGNKYIRLSLCTDIDRLSEAKHRVLQRKMTGS